MMYMGMTANVSAHAEAQGGVTRWVGCDCSFRPSCSINTARMTWGWVKLGYFYDLIWYALQCGRFRIKHYEFAQTIHIKPYHPFVEFLTHPHLLVRLTTAWTQPNSASDIFHRATMWFRVQEEFTRTTLQPLGASCNQTAPSPRQTYPKPLQSSLVCCSIKSEKKKEEGSLYTPHENWYLARTWIETGNKEKSWTAMNEHHELHLELASDKRRPARMSHELFEYARISLNMFECETSHPASP